MLGRTRDRGVGLLARLNERRLQHLELGGSLGHQVLSPSRVGSSSAGAAITAGAPFGTVAQEASASASAAATASDVARVKVGLKFRKMAR